jgi:hypothetical protein
MTGTKRRRGFDMIKTPVWETSEQKMTDFRGELMAFRVPV